LQVFAWKLGPFRFETMRNMKRNFSCNLSDFPAPSSLDFGATKGRQVSHPTDGDTVNVCLAERPDRAKPRIMSASHVQHVKRRRPRAKCGLVAPARAFQRSAPPPPTATEKPLGRFTGAAADSKGGCHAADTAALAICRRDQSRPAPHTTVHRERSQVAGRPRGLQAV